MTARKAQNEQKREKKEYSFKVIETCENLYVYKQKTHEEIARITGVSLAQIQRWSKKYEWRDKKFDQIKNRAQYRKNLYELRDKLLEDARADTNPQTIYALGGLQKIIESEEKMKPLEELPQEPGKELGLSPETLTKIKEEIYGIRAKQEN